MICHYAKYRDEYRNKTLLCHCRFLAGERGILAIVAEMHSLYHPSVGWKCQELGEWRGGDVGWMVSQQKAGLKSQKTQYLAYLLLSHWYWLCYNTCELLTGNRYHFVWVKLTVYVAQGVLGWRFDPQPLLSTCWPVLRKVHRSRNCSWWYSQHQAWFYCQ